MTDTVFSMLVLSTANITQETCNGWFHKELERDGVELFPNELGLPLTYTMPVSFYEKRNRGWFVHVNSDWRDSTFEEPLEPTVPADLRTVLEYAARRGYDWIMFCMDADVSDELPSYEW